MISERWLLRLLPVASNMSVKRNSSWDFPLFSDQLTLVNVLFSSFLFYTEVQEQPLGRPCLESWSKSPLKSPRVHGRITHSNWRFFCFFLCFSLCMIVTHINGFRHGILKLVHNVLWSYPPLAPLPCPPQSCWFLSSSQLPPSFWLLIVHGHCRKGSHVL